MFRLTSVLSALSISLAWDPHNMFPTPPMGWANWNQFGCNYNDSVIRQMADSIVSSGMVDVGYKTIIIQECITKTGHRDAMGRPMPDPEKFPHGMSDLVSYIHSKGLLAGIYTDVGSQTCAGYEGSFNYEEIDALTYAEWGIDLIEEDACHKPDNYSYEQLYTRMHRAIENAHNKTGHKIAFYMCVWGSDNVYQWGPSIGTIWRTTLDICPPGHATWSRMIRNFIGDTQYPNSTQIGAWQDPDMLIVGMDGLSPTEWKTHFSMWAMAAAPLWSAVDIRNLTQTVLDIYTNKEVVAVDQDALGKMALAANTTEFSGTTPGAVWFKTCSSGIAVLLINFHDDVKKITFSDISKLFPSGSIIQGRDLWKHSDIGEIKNDKIEVELHSHDSLMLLLTIGE